MIAVNCFMCDAELDEPGGLLFNPPTPKGSTRKRHLCKDCWKLLEMYFDRIKKEAKRRLAEEAKAAS